MKIEKYDLVVDLGNEERLFSVLLGSSEDDAIKRACRLQSISLNVDLVDIFDVMYLTTSGRILPQEEFRDVMCKVRDRKLDYKIDKCSKV